MQTYMWFVLFECTGYVGINATSKTKAEHNFKLCMIYVKQLTLIISKTKSENLIKNNS